MSDHLACIQWRRGNPSTAAPLEYSRRHEWHFDGGAVVAASASPSVVAPPWSDPAAVDPEEAFVASLSSCHMLWFLDIAARAGWVVDDYCDDAVGVMTANAQGKPWISLVTLRPRIAFAGDKRPDPAEVARLHHLAHVECYIANSVRSEVRVESPLPV